MCEGWGGLFCTFLKIILPFVVGSSLMGFFAGWTARKGSWWAIVFSPLIFFGLMVLIDGLPRRFSEWEAMALFLVFFVASPILIGFFVGHRFRRRGASS
jgi:predicted Na+-dependent transporter